MSTNFYLSIIAIFIITASYMFGYNNGVTKATALYSELDNKVLENIYQQGVDRGKIIGKQEIRNKLKKKQPYPTLQKPKEIKV